MLPLLVLYGVARLVCLVQSFERSKSEAGSDLEIDITLCSRLLNLAVGRL